MRLNHLTVSHFLNLISLNVPIDPATRVLFVCGDNGVGKTALAQGIRMSLTGQLVRGVAFKKDLSDLVTQGSKDGTFATTVSDGDKQHTYTFNVRTGNYSGSSPELPGNPLPLDPEQFIAMDAATRRKTLFGMAGIVLKPDVIVAALVEQGHELEHVQAVAGALRNGFDAAAKKADECASEARGGWKAVTGETYGDKKAAAWKAIPPSTDGLASVEDLDLQVGEALVRVDKAKDRAHALKHAAHAHAAAGDARTAQDNLPDNETALAELQTQRDSLAKEVEAITQAAQYKGGQTCPCPSCGDVLFWNSVGTLKKWDDAKPAMAAPEAFKQLNIVKDQLAQLDTKIDRVRALVAAGKGAAQLLASLPARPAPEDVTKAEQELTQAQAALAVLQADQRVAKNVAQEAAKAAERTEKAATFHADVQAYVKLATALPELPAKYLKQALDQVEQLLEAPSKAFGERISLEADMELRYGAIPYALASDSQQWRIRAAIGYVLAVMGGLGVMILDKFDVVQVKSRGPILAWLAKQQEVQVVLCGTLKERPKLPEPPFQIVWLES